MKRLISLLVSLLILGLLYWKVDVDRLLEVLAASDPGWLLASFTLFVPQVLLTAWRLARLMPAESRAGLAEATRLILAAAVFNLFLPAKMGELLKAWFMRDRGHATGAQSLALVVFERGCDLVGLLGWALVGLLFYPAEKAGWFPLAVAGVAIGLGLGIAVLGSPRVALAALHLAAGCSPARFAGRLAALGASWAEMHRELRHRPRLLAAIALGSVVLWWLHLVQIWLFTVALGKPVPFLANLALAPLALSTGLLPLTLAGIGTRDAALIFLYRPYLDPATSAALGWLCTARYVVLALAGLPFVHGYLRVVRGRE